MSYILQRLWIPKVIILSPSEKNITFLLIHKNEIHFISVISIASLNVSICSEMIFFLKLVFLLSVFQKTYCVAHKKKMHY